jgi:hypothetical protein
MDLKTRLTLQLATLFGDKDAARMIATHARLSLLTIDFDGTAAEIWTSVIEQAVLQKRIAELIACARKLFEDDDTLREAADLLAKDPRAFDPPPAFVEAPSRAPQQIWLIAATLVGAIIAVDVLELSRVAQIAIFTIVFIVAVPLLRRLLPSGDAAPASSTEPVAATIDLDSGMWGGLAGGVVTGALLSVVYHTRADPTVPITTLLPIVTVFFGVSVAALGCLVAAITSWFARMAQRIRGLGWLLNELSASLVAGLIAGVVSGAGIGWQFGKMKDKWQFAGPDILIAGIVPGCVVVGVFIALWDQKLVARHLTRSIVTSAIAAWIIGVIATAASDALSLRDYFFHALYDEGTAAARFNGGMIYGVMIGLLSGLVIGITILLSRRWTSVSSATRTERQPAETPSAA